MRDNNTKKPIVLTGGGTGGHIYPLIAVAEQLRIQKQPFIYVGSAAGREEKIVENLGYDFVGIKAGKWRRYLTWRSLGQNLIDIFNFGCGFFQALSILLRTGAPVVFSKGGFVALPMVLAAFLLRRRILIHESDSVMGLVNRLSSHLAVVIYTAFDPKIFVNSDRRYRRVGIPLRQKLEKAAKLRAPRKSRPLILIIGGIQGSVTLNRYVLGSLLTLVEAADVVHITGEAGFRECREIAATLPPKLQRSYKAFAFIDRELPYYLRAADLVISRASATTLAEAAMFAKPMYLVPLPTAAANHQVINARILAKAGAVEFNEQHELTASKFADRVVGLLANKKRLGRMGEKLRRNFYQPGAARKIAYEIINAEEAEVR